MPNKVAYAACEGGSRYRGCDRKSSVVREGKSYCWQHDPERLRRIAADRKIRLVKWEERKKEIATIESDHDKRIERNILLEQSGCDKLSNEVLRTIIELGGIGTIIEVAKEK